MFSVKAGTVENLTMKKIKYTVFSYLPVQSLISSFHMDKVKAQFSILPHKYKTHG